MPFKVGDIVKCKEPGWTGWLVKDMEYEVTYILEDCAPGDWSQLISLNVHKSILWGEWRFELVKD